MRFYVADFKTLFFTIVNLRGTLAFFLTYFFKKSRNSSNRPRLPNISQLVGNLINFSKVQHYNFIGKCMLNN